jgi:hypothetical protein
MLSIFVLPFGNKVLCIPKGANSIKIENLHHDHHRGLISKGGNMAIWSFFESECEHDECTDIPLFSQAEFTLTKPADISTPDISAFFFLPYNSVVKSVSGYMSVLDRFHSLLRHPPPEVKPRFLYSLIKTTVLLY